MTTVIKNHMMCLGAYALRCWPCLISFPLPVTIKIPVASLSVLRFPFLCLLLLLLHPRHLYILSHTFFSSFPHLLLLAWDQFICVCCSVQYNLHTFFILKMSWTRVLVVFLLTTFLILTCEYLVWVDAEEMGSVEVISRVALEI